MEVMSWYWSNKVIEIIMHFIYIHPVWTAIIVGFLFSGHGHNITIKQRE